MIQNKIIPDGWIMKPLSEVAPLQRGFDLPNSQIKKGPYPIVYSNGILNHHAKWMCKAPGLITGRSGTIGKFTYIEEGFYWPHNTSLWVTSFKDNIPLFVKYLFETVSFESYSTGTGVPTLNRNDLHTCPLILPKDKSEQQNIASALSSIDKLIDDLGRTIQKKQLIREGAMEELLSGKKRLPGFTEEWVEKKIGDIGKTYSGLTGKTKEDFGHGNAKYITFLNVLNNAILDISIFEAVDVRQNEKQNAAHYGDLFFNTSSETPEDVGTCACLNTEVPNLYLNSFCFGYRLNDEDVYGNFLAYFFRTKAGRDIMYSLAQGATRYNLSKEYFNEIKITMPSTIKEQQSISYVFEAMTDEISLLESERAKYEQIRSGMMEELLTGKKRLIKK